MDAVGDVLTVVLRWDDGTSDRTVLSLACVLTVNGSDVGTAPSEGCPTRQHGPFSQQIVLRVTLEAKFSAWEFR